MPDEEARQAEGAEAPAAEIKPEGQQETLQPGPTIQADWNKIQDQVDTKMFRAGYAAAQEGLKALEQAVKLKKTTLLTAIVNTQGMVGNPPRDKTAVVRSERTNTSYKYTYSPLPTILNTMRKAMTSEGLWYMAIPFENPNLEEEAPWKLTVTLYHGPSAESVECTVPLIFDLTPRFDRDGKRLPPRISNQNFGAAVSFMTRYALTGLLGISSEEDTDAAGLESETEQPPDQGQQPPKRGAQGLADHVAGQAATKATEKSRQGAAKTRGSASRPRGSASKTQKASSKQTATATAPPTDIEVQRYVESGKIIVKLLVAEPVKAKRMEIMQQHESWLHDCKRVNPPVFKRLMDIAKTGKAKAQELESK